MIDTPKAAATFTLEDLKALDAMLLQNGYDDETFAAMLPYVQTYLRALPELRAIPVGETVSALVMLPGGER